MLQSSVWKAGVVRNVPECEREWIRTSAGKKGRYILDHIIKEDKWKSFFIDFKKLNTMHKTKSLANMKAFDS